MEFNINDLMNRIEIESETKLKIFMNNLEEQKINILDALESDNTSELLEPDNTSELLEPDNTSELLEPDNTSKNNTIKSIGEFALDIMMKGSEEFKKETGRNLSYSEMRSLWG